MPARPHHIAVEPSRARGASLTELMIALAVGCGLIAAMGQVLATTRATQQFTTDSAEVTENASHALWTLVRDVRRAGFYGLPTATPVAVTPEWICPNATGSTALELFPIMTTSLLPPTCWRPAARRPGTLILTYAEPNTAERNATASADLLITANADGSMTWLAAPVAGSSAVIGAAHLHAYYIDSATADRADGCAGRVPALFRETRERRGPEPREEVARGIERIALRYGVDVDADGAVDNYVASTHVSNWSRIYAVKLWVLARSACADSNHYDNTVYELGDERIVANDHFRRVLLTTTVALRGRAGEWDGR